MAGKPVELQVELLDGSVVTIALNGQDVDFALSIMYKTGWFAVEDVKTKTIFPTARVKKIFVRTE